MKLTQQEMLYLAAVKSDLKMFLRHAFRMMYPHTAFMENWHIDSIVHELNLATKGAQPRLIINLPPRYLKSFIVSVVLPAFILGNDPTAKIICISYSDLLAKHLAAEFKRIVDADWYRQLFPEVKAVKSTENDFKTDLGGRRYATSVGGSLTGIGGDLLIIDDPIKPDDAYSDLLRNKNNDWYLNTVLSRLDDKQKGILILVMQRLHVNDLTGFIEDREGYRKISYPAIATQDEEIRLSATESYRRKAGEALHEARESLELLQQIHKNMGSNFIAQYQQTPEAPEGKIFKKNYIQLLDSNHTIKATGVRWVSIDAAASTAETADFTAITHGYSNPDAHYVLSSERGHFDYEMLKAKVIAIRERFPDVTFIVEVASAGISLREWFVKTGVKHITHNAKYSKETRAHMVVPIFEQKRVFILNMPGINAWVKPFVNELLAFPYGKNDDQVDSLVQALRWAERRVNPGGKICFM
jgi:predicted phage terminase large subunit-like protein